MAFETAKFQFLVETDSRKIDEIRKNFAFCVKKRSKRDVFRICNLQVAAASRRRREAIAESESFVYQHVDAQVFHVKQKVNKNSGLSSRRNGFHFWPFSGFYAGCRCDFVAEGNPHSAAGSRSPAGFL